MKNWIIREAIVKAIKKYEGGSKLTFYTTNRVFRNAFFLLMKEVCLSEQPEIKTLERAG